MTCTNCTRLGCMNDFVAYEPNASARNPAVSVGIRPAVPTDVRALAAVMSVRGGAVEEHTGRATGLIEKLPVLLVAEKSGVVVGWCGVQKHSILPNADPE